MSDANTPLYKSPVFLLAVPTALIVALYYFVTVPLLDRQEQATRADDLAYAAAGRVDQATASLKLQLETIADDPGIALALQNQDSSAIKSKAAYCFTRVKECFSSNG